MFGMAETRSVENHLALFAAGPTEPNCAPEECAVAATADCNPADCSPADCDPADCLQMIKTAIVSKLKAQPAANTNCAKVVAACASAKTVNAKAACTQKAAVTAESDCKPSECPSDCDPSACEPTVKAAKNVKVAAR